MFALYISCEAIKTDSTGLKFSRFSSLRLEGRAFSVYSVFMTSFTNVKTAIYSAALVFTSLVAQAGLVHDPMRPAIPLMSEKRMPPRPPQGIQNLDTEALTHNFQTRGAPAGWLVPNVQGQIGRAHV